MAVQYHWVRTSIASCLACTLLGQLLCSSCLLRFSLPLVFCSQLGVASLWSTESGLFFLLLFLSLLPLLQELLKVFLKKQSTTNNNLMMMMMMMMMRRRRRRRRRTTTTTRRRMMMVVVMMMMIMMMVITIYTIVGLLETQETQKTLLLLPHTTRTKQTAKRPQKSRLCAQSTIWSSACIFPATIILALYQFWLEKK